MAHAATTRTGPGDQKFDAVEGGIYIGTETATGIILGQEGLPITVLGVGIAQVPSYNTGVVYVDASALASTSAFTYDADAEIVATTHVRSGTLVVDPNGQGTPAIAFDTHEDTGIAYDTSANALVTLQDGAYATVGRRTYILTSGETMTLLEIPIEVGETIALAMDFAVRVSVVGDAEMQSTAGVAIVSAYHKAADVPLGTVNITAASAQSLGTLTTAIIAQTETADAISIRMTATTDLPDHVITATITMRFMFPPSGTVSWGNP